MSIYDDRREELEKHELMMGAERGRLAVTLDLLTDALVLVGQHGVYCQSARQAGKPAMDIQMISKCLTDAKELVASVMEQIQRKKADEQLFGRKPIVDPDPNEGHQAQDEHK